MTTNQTNVDLNIIKQDLQELYLLGKNKYYSNDLMTENEGLFLKKLNQDLFHEEWWIPNKMSIRQMLHITFQQLYYNVYQIPYEYLQANQISMPYNYNIDPDIRELIRQFLAYVQIQDVNDNASFEEEQFEI